MTLASLSMNQCDILILIAMQAEADSFIQKWEMTEFVDPSLAPLPARCYRTSSQRIILVTHGKDPAQKFDYVGTQFAAITTWETIKAFQPKIIINAGTAGGFAKEGAQIGDVYINSQGCQYHDRQISIAEYHAFCHKPIESKLAQSLIKEHSFLKEGSISSGNSLDTTSEEIDRIARSGAHLKDMEAATVAEVATLFKKEIIALKAVTDLLDGEHPSATEFLQNLQLASNKLTEALDKVVRKLVGEV